MHRPNDEPCDVVMPCNSSYIGESDIGGFDYGVGFFRLEVRKENPIKHYEVKKIYNNIHNRNRGRNNLENNLAQLIMCVERYKDFLTPTDKKELKEAFALVMKEL